MLLSDLSWHLWGVGFYPPPSLPDICLVWGSPTDSVVSKRGLLPLPLSHALKVMGTVGLRMAQLVFPPRGPQSSHPQLLLCVGSAPFWRQSPGRDRREVEEHWGYIISLGLELRFVISDLQLLLSFLPDAGLCPSCAGLYGEMTVATMNQHRPWAPTQPHTAFSQWAGIASTDLSFRVLVLF